MILLPRDDVWEQNFVLCMCVQIHGFIYKEKGMGKLHIHIFIYVYYMYKDFNLYLIYVSIFSFHSVLLDNIFFNDGIRFHYIKT